LEISCRQRDNGDKPFVKEKLRWSLGWKEIIVAKGIET